jgi:hypothetical protein
MKFDFLNGATGEQSSKRLFTFILVILFVIVLLSNLYFGKELKPSLEDNLLYLILVTFAGVTLEKPINNFAKKMKVEEKKSE